ncbi:hypothetical protein SAMN05421504_103261 [Amycolatopsis xylanica]|uniref:Uncharacterized protein n=1 Tax=Amycolatopsis xylanica TaxID=589385 RepID=A0A1H3D4R6_9PSEU|nr:hypothetical protein [Amycolatopsis xylanica]SDX61463.1 hypothetical protein SAMN05421504_103261 [Amycolatopsis xylanica]
MSVVKRQRTCAVCGAPFADGEQAELEPLIDGVIRYLAVHPGHSTWRRSYEEELPKAS